MKKSTVTGAILSAVTLAAGLLAGLEGTRYHAYRDFAMGVWTICEGHTRGVKEGDTATPAQCAAYKRQDLLEANTEIDRCITTPLSVNQRAALLLSVINLGSAVVCGSTLMRKANDGDIEGACRELTDAKNSKGEATGWTYAGGKRYAGLMTRRRIERDLCWPDFSNVVAA